INKGSNYAFEEAGGDLLTATDVAGSLRLIGNRIDIGAYESQFLIETYIRYVKSAGSGGSPGGDGKSWSTASSDWEAMINALAALDSGEVWVAAGTYHPSTSTVRGVGSYRLKNRVAVYGGFAGTEYALEHRNWEANQTILHGQDVITVIN